MRSLRRVRLMLVAAVAASLSAAEPAETAAAVIARVQAGVPEHLLGSGVLAAALTRAFDAEQWEPAAWARWHLALARAHLLAEAVDAAAVSLQELARLPLDATQMRALRLLRIEHWRLQVQRDPATVDPPSIAAAMIDAPPEIRLQAWLAEALRADLRADHAAAFSAYDEALTLAPVDERPALYLRRILAMEAAGQRSATINAWLVERDDPAATALAQTLGTAASALVGTAMPSIALPFLGEPEEIWRSEAARGRPLLLYFYAHWAPGCRPIDPLVVAAAARHPRLRVVSISLHRAEARQQALAYAAQQGLPPPVLGDGAGWEQAVLGQFAVESIPHIVLVDAAGMVRFTDIIGPEPALSHSRLTQALARILDEETTHDAAMP